MGMRFAATTAVHLIPFFIDLASGQYFLERPTASAFVPIKRTLARTVHRFFNRPLPTRAWKIEGQHTNSLSDFDEIIRSEETSCVFPRGDTTLPTPPELNKPVSDHPRLSANISREPDDHLPIAQDSHRIGPFY